MRALGVFALWILGGAALWLAAALSERPGAVKLCLMCQSFGLACLFAATRL